MAPGTTSLILCAVLLVIQTAIWLQHDSKNRKERMQLTKLLASRNFSEFSVGEARLSRKDGERKPDGSYGDVWSEEQDG